MVTALFVCRFVLDLLVQQGVLTSLKMMQLFERPSINFIGKRHIAAIVSLSLIVIGMSCFAVRATRQTEALAQGSAPSGDSLLQTPMYGIELTGGDMLYLRFSNNLSVAQLRSALSAVGQGDSMIQRVGGESEFLIRSPFNSSTSIVATLDQQFGSNMPEILEEDRIGPAIGGELKTKAILSIALALLVIVAYIWYRFQFIYGIAATAALAHDVLITLGALALGGYQISLGVIAALLTIVGYSLNDTIVVFDRIREDLHVERNLSFKDILNLSINQTLSRTTLTSLTTLFVVVCLFIFGGEVIRDFAFTLLVGIIVGTYSSVFVASPLLLMMKRSGQSVKKVTA
jgi:preprotein translocase SecF subunit